VGEFPCVAMALLVFGQIPPLPLAGESGLKVLKRPQYRPGFKICDLDPAARLALLADGRFNLRRLRV